MRKISAHYLIPANNKEPISRGLVILDDDGTVLEVRKMQQEEESTEFYDGILIPGFVNSHLHIELSHLKGKFTKGSGMAGFIRQINQLRESSPLEQRLSLIEEQLDALYKSGVSAMADISNCDESFAAKAKSKIYTHTFLEVFGTEPKDAQAIIERVVELDKKAKECGLISSPTPHSCYTMSPQLLQGVAKLGLEQGSISYHSQESWEEEELILTGGGPLAWEYKGRSLSTPEVRGTPSLLYFLEKIAHLPLTKEQKILLVHNTFTNRESVMAAKGCEASFYWALCPLSNLFIHNMLPPVLMLKEQGVTITLGTDSLSSNDKLSMVAEMATLQEYFPFLSLYEIVEWATFNGAKFLGVEKSLGSIEVGKKPGIVLIEGIDWESMRLLPNCSSTRLV